MLVQHDKASDEGGFVGLTGLEPKRQLAYPDVKGHANQTQQILASLIYLSKATWSLKRAPAGKSSQ